MTDENIGDRIKPGDRVKLRCGAVFEARDVGADRNAQPNRTFYEIGGLLSTHWFPSGVMVPGVEAAFDIVEILPRPLTDAERLAKIADLVASRGERTDVLSAIMALAAPPAPVDPGREVTQEEWDDARQYGQNNAAEAATQIVRTRLAEAEAARHE